MKATLTLISRAALVAGVLVAVSAQSASAHSVDKGSDRGRSCWAHSRHKAHKHTVGHDHHVCDRDDDHGDHDDDHDDDRDDVPTTSTTVPSGSGDGSTPDSGSSESTPSDRDSSPAVDGPTASTIPATTVPAPRADDVVAMPVDESVSRPSNPVSSTPDRPAENLPTENLVLVDSPEAGGNTPIGGPGGASTTIGPADSTDDSTPGFFAGGISPGSIAGLWWVLVLMVAVAEALRRVRRSGVLTK